ncbi:DUF2278 family protein [Paraburkholderia metrosideri]|uniref:DUF2278 family protein n=1 Tax=Paraburkholderia metrosideri TaxID=580937 RepID=A0ABN7HR12_9BURK|nr:DUF2278 family protein [Paraburkholderia metrosideri]CAD6532403.1 hypothetical protein LMG28140_02624 [Paraburkholderia metrosideri]
MANEYCMFKGTLGLGVPFFRQYHGSPHYVIVLENSPGENFMLVVNAASDTRTQQNDNRVLSLVSTIFEHPMLPVLQQLPAGLHTAGFPRLDYWQDKKLVDVTRMRPIPYDSTNGDQNDINDLIDDALTIDRTQPSQDFPYKPSDSDVETRQAWKPASGDEITVYGFGFLFEPEKDGMHELHMNQGNPPTHDRNDHSKENGTFHDGAVIVQSGTQFSAIFTAFQTQLLPTGTDGYPEKNAKPILSLTTHS